MLKSNDTLTSDYFKKLSIAGEQTFDFIELIIQQYDFI